MSEAAPAEPKKRRNRRTNEEIQLIMSQIVKLKVSGGSDADIRQVLGLTVHTYRTYRAKLRDQWVNERFAERDEYLIEHIRLAEEGLQRDRRTFQEVMNSDKASPTAKVLAAKSDAEILLYMVRLRYEAKLYANQIASELRPGVPAKVIQLTR